MDITAETLNRIRDAVQPERLLETAVRLIEIPSPTRAAARAADCLAEILQEDGFGVERPHASWPAAPAIVSRFASPRPGRVLQFDGHLDTVHLPFVAPRVERGVLYGSGAADMKGGVAAMVEAVRALRDSGLLFGGAILLTAHDLHELPWGDGSQLDAMIAAGYVGDGVLLPEYLADCLPVIGRGLAVLNIRVTRRGHPVHEVLGGIDEPSVVLAGSEVVVRLAQLDERLAQRSDRMAGRESVFVGQIAAGEIYNQAPTELTLAGTRRWLPGTSFDDVQRELRELLGQVAIGRGVQIDGNFQLARDAFRIDADHDLVAALQAAHEITTGIRLPLGAKPFVDDGNSFVALGGVPAITHGPNASGAHTLEEHVPLAELVRVATVYALTAVAFCGSQTR